MTLLSHDSKLPVNTVCWKMPKSLKWLHNVHPQILTETPKFKSLSPSIKNDLMHTSNSRCHYGMLQPPSSPNNKQDTPSTFINMYCNNSDLEKNKALHLIQKHEEKEHHHHPSHQTIKEVLQHPIQHQCLPLMESHVQSTCVYQLQHQGIQMETWHVQ